MQLIDNWWLKILFVSKKQSFVIDGVGLGPLYPGEDFEKKSQSLEPVKNTVEIALTQIISKICLSNLLMCFASFLENPSKP